LIRQCKIFFILYLNWVEHHFHITMYIDGQS